MDAKAAAAEAGRRKVKICDSPRISLCLYEFIFSCILTIKDLLSFDTLIL